MNSGGRADALGRTATTGRAQNVRAGPALTPNQCDAFLAELRNLALKDRSKVPEIARRAGVAIRSEGSDSSGTSITGQLWTKGGQTYGAFTLSLTSSREHAAANAQVIIGLVSARAELEGAEAPEELKRAVEALTPQFQDALVRGFVAKRDAVERGRQAFQLEMEDTKRARTLVDYMAPSDELLTPSQRERLEGIRAAGRVSQDEHDDFVRSLAAGLSNLSGNLRNSPLGFRRYIVQHAPDQPTLDAVLSDLIKGLATLSSNDEAASELLSEVLLARLSPRQIERMSSAVVSALLATADPQKRWPLTQFLLAALDRGWTPSSAQHALLENMFVRFTRALEYKPYIDGGADQWVAYKLAEIVGLSSSRRGREVLISDALRFCALTLKSPTQKPSSIDYRLYVYNCLMRWASPGLPPVQDPILKDSLSRIAMAMVKAGEPSRPFLDMPLTTVATVLKNTFSHVETDGSDFSVLTWLLFLSVQDFGLESLVDDALVRVILRRARSDLFDVSDLAKLRSEVAIEPEPTRDQLLLRLKKLESRLVSTLVGEDRASQAQSELRNLLVEEFEVLLPLMSSDQIMKLFAAPSGVVHREVREHIWSSFIFSKVRSYTNGGNDLPEALTALPGSFPIPEVLAVARREGFSIKVENGIRLIVSRLDAEIELLQSLATRPGDERWHGMRQFLLQQRKTRRDQLLAHLQGTGPVKSKAVDWR